MDAPVDREDVRAIINGVFELGRRPGTFMRKWSRSAGCWRTMEKEPRKIRTADDVLAMSSAEFHEWSQRRLAERIAYHERRSAEEGVLVARPRVETAEDLLSMPREQQRKRAARLLAERIAYHERRREEERAERERGGSTS